MTSKRDQYLLDKVASTTNQPSLRPNRNLHHVVIVNIKTINTLTEATEPRAAGPTLESKSSIL